MKPFNPFAGAWPLPLAVALALAGLVVSLLGASARANEAKIKESGRAVFEKHADSVLFVAFTVEIDMQLGGQGHQAMEQSLETLGTVIQEDGLMVVPNSSIDLAGQIRAQIRQSFGPDAEVKVTTEIKSLKIILADGSEVEADLLLQDSDLDFAFIKPKPAEEGTEAPVWNPVSLQKDAPRVKPLDTILILGRMSENVNRVPNILAGTIESSVRRPRLIYRSSVDALGVPAFNLDGEVAGIFVRQSASNGLGSFVIRPPRDVLKIAAQISEKKSEAEKPQDEE